MSFRRRGTRLGLLVIPPLGFIAAGSVADRTGSWATYYNYRVVRSQAADFGGQIVYNEQTRPIFDQIHWTENHLAMLRQASYFDPVVFSADNLRFLLAKFPRRLVPEGAGGHLREFATPSRPRFTPASCLQAERSFSPPWGAGPGLPCWRPG